MKIIVSHDVDHLSVLEHHKEWMIPKFLIRTFLEAGLRKIQTKEVYHRLLGLLRNRWHNLDELVDFDAVHDVPATYFVGVENGRQLSYPLSEAEKWILKIKKSGFEVGVHGICYDSAAGIKKEFCRFRNVLPEGDAGIRMHCLSRNSRTVESLADAGYRFDCTVAGLQNPFFVEDRIWEFPLQLMDSELFCKGARWQTQDLERVKKQTVSLLERAKAEGLRYFSVLFHDFYYSEAFRAWKQWYEWFVGYASDNGYEFINYADAIKEMEGQCNAFRR